MICCYLIVSWFVGWVKALLLLSEHYALDTGFAMPWQEGLLPHIKRAFQEGFFLHMSFQAILLLDCLQKKAFLRKNANQF
jgi:hypothetical protein